MGRYANPPRVRAGVFAYMKWSGQPKATLSYDYIIMTTIYIPIYHIRYPGYHVERFVFKVACNFSKYRSSMLSFLLDLACLRWARNDGLNDNHTCCRRHGAESRHSTCRHS